MLMPASLPTSPFPANPKTLARRSGAAAERSPPRSAAAPANPMPITPNQTLPPSFHYKRLSPPAFTSHEIPRISNFATHLVKLAAVRAERALGATDATEAKKYD